MNMDRAYVEPLYLPKLTKKAMNLTKLRASIWDFMVHNLLLMQKSDYFLKFQFFSKSPVKWDNMNVTSHYGSTSLPQCH